MEKDSLIGLFAMFDYCAVPGQGSQDVWFDKMFILLGPTHVAFAKRTTIGAFLHRALADGIGDHLGSLFISSGEVDFVAQVK